MVWFQEFRRIGKGRSDCEGPCKSAHIHRLAWAFIAWWCYKYYNLMCCIDLNPQTQGVQRCEPPPPPCPLFLNIPWKWNGIFKKNEIKSAKRTRPHIYTYDPPFPEILGPPLKSKKKKKNLIQFLVLYCRHLWRKLSPTLDELTMTIGMIINLCSPMIS